MKTNGKALVVLVQRVDAEKAVRYEELVILLQCNTYRCLVLWFTIFVGLWAAALGTLQALSSIIMFFPPQSVLNLPVAVNNIRESHG